MEITLKAAYDSDNTYPDNTKLTLSADADLVYIKIDNRTVGINRKALVAAISALIVVADALD